MFVFAFEVVGPQAPLPAEQLYREGKSTYGFIGIRLTHYVRAARPISAKWDTFAMPTREFRRWAAPAEAFFRSPVDRSCGL